MSMFSKTHTGTKTLLLKQLHLTEKLFKGGLVDNK